MQTPPEPTGDSSPSGQQPRAEDPPPVQIGKYVIERLLGKGGMGAVYLARDTELGREVALKVLTANLTNADALVRRFKQEALAVSALAHEHIVRVYEAGQVDDQLFMALEYLPGIDVQRLINQHKRLSIRRTVEIVRQVALALGHAAEKGIVHRDVKPSNLLIAKDGKVKLTDMGLARFVDETADAHITRSGTTVGTVDYISPEQARDSRSTDTRSDLYSLGCAWYHMLTGQVPFPEGTLSNKIIAHATRKRPNPRKLNPRISRSVATVVQRLMARKPEDRYQTPAEFLEALDALPALVAGKADSSGTMPSSGDGADSGPSLHSLASVSGSTDRLAAAPPPLPGRSASGAKKRGKQSGTKPKETDSSRLFLIISGVVGLVLLLSIAGILFFDRTPPAPPEEVTRRNFETPIPKPVDPPPVEPSPEVDGPSPEDWVRTPEADRGQLVFAKESDRSLLPNWTAPRSTPLPEVTVGRGPATPPGEVETLAEALDRIPSEGLRIRLHGPGPYFLPPHPIRSEGPLQIEGEPNGGTVVLFPHSVSSRQSMIPGETDSRATLLSLRAPQVTFRNLHLAEDSGEARLGTDGVLLTVTGPELILDRVSLISVGRTSEPITAIAHRNPGGPARLFLNQVFLRGERMQPVSIDAAYPDVVAYQSAIVSRNRPLFDLRVGLPPLEGLVEPKTDTGEDLPTISVQGCRLSCFESSLISAGGVLTLNNGLSARMLQPGDSPFPVPPTWLLLRNCRIGQPDPSLSPPLVAFDHWPATEDSRRPDHLRLRLDRSDLLGWQTFLTNRTTDASTTSLRTFSRWFPESESRPNIEPSDHWPERSQISLATLTPKSLGLEDRLPFPSANNLVAARGWIRRADPPRFPETTASPIKIDLNRQDLNRAIEAGNYPNGTEFEVIGVGVCYLSPIVLKNQHYRFVFRSREGVEPLTIRPRALESGGGETAAESRGLFVVEQGTLELIGLPVEMKFLGGSEYPQSIVSAQDSRVRLQQCSFRGPTRLTDEYKALIVWGTDRKFEANTTPDPYGELLIDRSYLRDDRSVIDADLVGQHLWLVNSVFDGPRILDGDFTGGSEAKFADIVLDHSTLVGTDTLIALRVDWTEAKSGPPDPGRGTPLSVYASHNLLTHEPSAAKETKPTESGTEPSESPQKAHGLNAFVELIDETVLGRDVTWWGLRNGFESQDPDTLLKRWIEFWEGPHARDSIAETALITFEKPNRTKAAYRIRSDAEANRWSATGTTLGADLEKITPLEPVPAPVEPDPMTDGESELDIETIDSSPPQDGPAS